jgi:hypothetical protein
MPKGQKRQRKLLGNPDRHLLFVKGTLDMILAKAEGLPDQVKESLVAARDLAWQSFAGKTEKTNKPTR